MLSRCFLQKALRLSQIGGSETLCEPAVHRSERLACLVTPVVFREESREADGRPELEAPLRAAAGDLDRSPEALFSLHAIATARQQFALDPLDLSGIDDLTM